MLGCISIYLTTLLANQLLPLVETPLQRKLGYGSQDNYVEFRLVELQSSAAGSHVNRRNRRSLHKSFHRADSDESLDDGSSLVPKEEGMVYYVELAKCGVVVHCLFTNNG